MTTTTTEIDLLEGLEKADQSAAAGLKDSLPPTLGFDPDSKRGGMYGGFYAAEDQVETSRYDFTSAPADGSFRKRVNGPLKDQQFPCVHLGEKTHFALVAAGPLHKKLDKENREKYHFEAVVLVREIIDRQTGEPALFKLALTGIAAVRLWSHFTQDIAEPLGRLTEHARALARRLYEAGDARVTKERYENALARVFTPQDIWIPVSVRYEAQLGRDASKAQIGTAPDTHAGEGRKRESRWKEISVQDLALIDAKGGLRLSEKTASFCRENRQKYEAILKERASRADQSPEAATISDEGLGTRSAQTTGLRQDEKAAERDTATKTEVALKPSPAPHTPPSAPKAAETAAKTNLSARPPAPGLDPETQARVQTINDKITQAGKSEDEVKEYLKLKYGKEKVEDLSPAQMAEFEKLLDKKIAAAK